MNPFSSAEITTLLVRSGQGDKAALDQLLPLVYQELHRLAHHQSQKEHAHHSLQTTGLVHEAYLRLAARGAGGVCRIRRRRLALDGGWRWRTQSCAQGG